MAKSTTAKGPAALGKYVRESREELKKVSWPSREVTIRYSLIVVVASVGVGLLTGAFDYVLSLIVESII